MPYNDPKSIKNSCILPDTPGIQTVLTSDIIILSLKGYSYIICTQGSVDSYKGIHCKYIDRNLDNSDLHFIWNTGTK